MENQPGRDDTELNLVSVLTGLSLGLTYVAISKGLNVETFIFASLDAIGVGYLTAYLVTERLDL